MTRTKQWTKCVLSRARKEMIQLGDFFQSLSFSLSLSGCSSSSAAPTPALLEPLTRLKNQRTTLALVYGESAWGYGSRDIHVQARCCQPMVLGARVQVGRRNRKQKASQPHKQRVTSYILLAGLGRRRSVLR